MVRKLSLCCLVMMPLAAMDPELGLSIPQGRYAMNTTQLATIQEAPGSYSYESYEFLSTDRDPNQHHLSVSHSHIEASDGTIDIYERRENLDDQRISEIIVQRYCSGSPVAHAIIPRIRETIQSHSDSPRAT